MTTKDPKTEPIVEEKEEKDGPSFLSNITQIKIIRPKNIETTSLGAAYLAGLQSGIIKNTKEINKFWEKDKILKSKIPKNKAISNINKWKSTIRAVNKFY